jgi:hypothetical protein
MDEVWKQADELFARADRIFAGLERSGWTIRTVTYTTNTTADPKPAPTYSEGFADGWNAREAI